MISEVQRSLKHEATFENVCWAERLLLQESFQHDTDGTSTRTLDFSFSAAVCLATSDEALDRFNETLRKYSSLSDNQLKEAPKSTQLGNN